MNSSTTLTDSIIFFIVAVIVAFCIACIFSIATDFIIEMINQETKQNDKDTNNKN